MKPLVKIVPVLLATLTLFFSNLATARYIVRPLDQAVFHNNQGITYLGQKQVQKALFEFKTATELSPDHLAYQANHDTLARQLGTKW